MGQGAAPVVAQAITTLADYPCTVHAFAMPNPKTTKMRRNVTAAVLSAGILAALLTGCGGGPATPLTAPTPYESLPESVSADTSDCTPGGLLYAGCVRQAEARAKAEGKDNAEANATAAAESAAQRRAYNAAQADAAKSPLDRFMGSLNFLFYIGAGLLISGIIALFSANRIVAPRGQDPHGPAAGAAEAKASGERSLGTAAIAVGVVLLAGWMGGFGTAIIAAVVAGPIAYMAMRRQAKLDAAETGFKLAERHWRAAVAEAQQHADASASAPHDDLGLGLAPQVSQVHVPEPHMSIAEAVLYGRTGGVPVEARSAAAQLLDRMGTPRPAQSAWLKACEAAKLGVWSTDEKPKFTPSVDLVGVRALDGGDARITV